MKWIVEFVMCVCPLLGEAANDKQMRNECLTQESQLLTKAISGTSMRDNSEHGKEDHGEGSGENASQAVRGFSWMA